MIWLAALVGLVLVVAIAVAAVSRVSVELEGTIAPALLEIDDAVEVVAASLPFEVSAIVSHDDVRQVVHWVLAWFDELGMVSDFGEELGGEWIREERAVADEIGAVDYAVAQALDDDVDIDVLHVTVIVDSFVWYLRDIGAVGDEVR
ncbi:MAG: hypothetical protein ACI81L_002276 [Verrucomicrobiales bacterium]|jgi:hypothetical protein